jgi:acetamidase/formamidase
VSIPAGSSPSRYAAPSDIEDISAIPTPFTPACDGHPLAPIAGPIVVRGARPGDVVAIDLIEPIPFGSGKSAIVRDFGVLRREFPDPMAVSCEVRDGRAWFVGRIPLPLNPNLGTISTMPPEGYKPSYAGAYGGDFDQKDAGQGSRIYLPVLVEDALVFFDDPHAAISDGIINGTGIECSMNVRARINLLKDRGHRPLPGCSSPLAAGPSSSTNRAPRLSQNRSSLWCRSRQPTLGRSRRAWRNEHRVEFGHLHHIPNHGRGLRRAIRTIIAKMSKASRARQLAGLRSQSSPARRSDALRFG